MKTRRRAATHQVAELRSPSQEASRWDYLAAGQVDRYKASRAARGKRYISESFPSDVATAPDDSTAIASQGDDEPRQAFGGKAASRVVADAPLGDLEGRQNRTRTDRQFVLNDHGSSSVINGDQQGEPDWKRHFEMMRRQVAVPQSQVEDLNFERQTDQAPPPLYLQVVSESARTTRPSL